MAMETASKSAEALAAPSRLMRTYTLGVLVLIYISNFIDRTIIGIVAQPMKEDLQLADWQLGLLSGMAFALFYVILGLPIARLAERFNRVTIISVSLAVWSGMTALCGLAQNFTHLLLCRVGVATGEAGCSPAAQSIISDYYPPEKRATALSIYTLGVPLGKLMGALGGSVVAQYLDWRAAFMVVGLPGIVLAGVTKLTVREPKRGAFDKVGDSKSKIDAPSFIDTVRFLVRKKAFVHVALGMALCAFGGYGIQAFAVPFLLRGYELTLVQAATGYGVIAGIASAIGTTMGGWLTDRYSVRTKKAYGYVPAIGVFVAGPFYIAVALQSSTMAMAGLVIIPALFQYFHMGPTYALTANLVKPRMRATATAILLLVINIIGLGFGPSVTGALSDYFAARAFTGINFLESCPGGLPAPNAADVTLEMCRTASFLGLRYALIAITIVFIWSGIHYLLAAKYAEKDLDNA